MTILQINKFYYLKGGAERYFFDLKELLEKNGHKVIPFAMKTKHDLPTKYNKYFISRIKTLTKQNIFKIFKTIFRFWWSREAQRNLEGLLKKEKIDIAHVHNIYHQISPSILPVLKKHGIPIVMTVHDYNLISPNYNLYLNGKVYDRVCGGSYWKCLFDRCVRNSFWQSLVCVIEMYLHHRVYRKYVDVFIAPSKFVARKLVRAGFDKDKIRIVPHFIYPSYPPLRKGRDKNSPPYEGGVRGGYILYFGRLSEEKGVQVLIEAMKKLPNIKLKIVGSGPQENSYKLKAISYKLKNVELLSHKSRDELQNLILNSQFVVVPSLAPETFGLSALEAMALGKCVVASNIGALPELIDKDCLVKPGDIHKLAKKIQVLTKDEKYVRIRGQENREKVKRLYDQKEHYKEILAIYKGLERF